MLKICALALLFAFMALILRSFGFRGAAAFTALAVAFLLSRASSELASLGSFGELKELLPGDALEYVGAIAKVVGAGYLFGICADVCQELGESGIAKAVSVAGRAEILLIASPYVVRIIDVATELLK